MIDFSGAMAFLISIDIKENGSEENLLIYVIMYPFLKVNFGI